MRVELVAWTTFDTHAAELASEMEYHPRDDRAQELIEFAGRQCYRSWGRPNQATATNEGYLEHIIEVGHLSVLEHGSATFHVGHVSRSLTHELIRHRHLSYSQLSQRFVVAKNTGDFVVPPLFSGNEAALNRLERAWYSALDIYDELLAIAEDMPETKRKEAREAARAVLPNMTPTDIVVTGNHRAWREMLMKRGTAEADAEICALAVEILGHLKGLEPNVYADLDTVRTDTGRTIIVQGSQKPGKAVAGPLGTSIQTNARGTAVVGSGGSVDRFEVTTVHKTIKDPHLYKGTP